MKALLCFLVAGLCVCVMTGRSQEIESKLTGSTAAQGFTVRDNANNALLTVRGNGNIGIGITSPAFRLTLDGDAGILATGTYNSGPTLPSYVGPLMCWYPRKAAFRAGNSISGTWDDANIGIYSFAAGLGAKASADATTAFGNYTVASGYSAFAAGYKSEASASASTAFGSSTQASGNSSTALGSGSIASGSYSLAAGQSAIAAGTASFAFGRNTNANGEHSIAIGTSVSTNQKSGTMYLGDASSTSTRYAYADNHFYAVFDHGYSLFTDASGGNSYCVYLLNHSTSWSSCSDSTKKERRMPVDGERFLEKFSRLQLGSWNFIGHDPLTERHYGPMAQEWFSAFGHDGVGTIGSDTLLASADVDGVLCIAVQALGKRTTEMRKRVAAQEERIQLLERRLTEKDLEIARLHARFAAFQTETDRRYEALVRYIRGSEHQDDPLHARLLHSEAK